MALHRQLARPTSHAEFLSYAKMYRIYGELLDCVLDRLKVKAETRDAQIAILRRTDWECVNEAIEKILAE